VGIPAALFLGLECGLRVAGFGQPVAFLIPDEKPGYLRTNPDFVGSFLPSGFDLRPLNFRVAAHKQPNTVRIVVLGESAAQGVPVPAFGFAAQLRALLRDRYPGREVEVINTGIVAINSHVVRRIARELSGLTPDLVVVYMGNNEVVGPYGPGCAYLSQMPPLWFIRLSVLVRSTRTGQLISSAANRLARRRGRPEEWGGMAMFANSAVGGDDPRLEAVYTNFEANLRDIIGLATAAGAKTLVCTVGSNLKDCAPFLSVHRSGLTEQELSTWDRAFRAGRIAWILGDSGKALSELQEALRIDPKYADCAFLVGSLELKSGRMVEARRDLLQAEHWDALRFRPDPRINGIIRSVAAGAGPTVRLVDAARALGSAPDSDGAPSGKEQFFEHVHLNWDGNFELAGMLAAASEESLYGSVSGARPWLDSAGCAAALGYTEHERLNLLQKVEAIVRNPPFTNQLTYCEDEAALARALARAKADRGDPLKTSAAREVVGASLARDPANADLAGLEAGIDDDLGDLDGALAQSTRVGELEPRSPALAADRALKLVRLGRFGPAEESLRAAAQACSERDRSLMAPAFAELYARSRRFGEGMHYFGDEIARRPDDRSLRIIRAELLGLSGDSAGAERQYREILVEDPSNATALEGLIGLLGQPGRSPEADEACLRAVPHQSGNQSNNLRAAIIHDKRHEEEQTCQCLIAAERSGPVTSGLESNLARRLLRLGRADDALEHLGLARRLALLEGDSGAVEAIGIAIERVATGR
jgi:tetratricopeptide (TPR) repeat protein